MTTKRLMAPDFTAADHLVGEGEDLVVGEAADDLAAVLQLLGGRAAVLARAMIGREVLHPALAPVARCARSRRSPRRPW